MRFAVSPWLTERRLVGGAVILLTAWGLWARFRLPLQPIAELDAWHFVNPALSALAGRGFFHTEGGTCFYPAILLGILGWVEDMRAITVVQHLFGVAGGLLIWRAWQNVRAFHPSLLPRFLHTAAGLLLLGTVLLSEDRISFEHRLRPEALTGFFTALNFALTLEFIRVRRQRGTASVASTALGALALTNSFLLFFLKPAFFLAALFASVPMVFFLCFRREPWPFKCWLVVPPAAVILIFCSLERPLAKSDAGGQEFLAKTLFVIHARIIADQMAADLASTTSSVEERAWLGGVHDSLLVEMASSRSGHVYPTLGFDPDYLMYGDSICARLDREISDPARRRGFYRYWYQRSLWNQPLPMAGKIIRELREFYGSAQVLSDARTARPLGKWYQSSYQAFRYRPDEITRLPLGKDYLAACKALGKSRAVNAEPFFVRWVLGVLSFLYSPLLLANVLLALAMIFCRELRTRYGMLLGLAALFYSYNFGNCLGTAVVHSLSIKRYISAQFVSTLFSEAVGLWLVMEVIRWIVPFFARRTARPQASGAVGAVGTATVETPESVLPVQRADQP